MALGCKMTRTSGLIIPSGVHTVVPFEAVVWDDGAFCDIATNPERITFQTAGRYDVWAALAVNSNKVAQVWFTLWKGDALIIGGDKREAVSGNTTSTLRVTYEFAAGEYATLRVYHNNTSGMNLFVAPEYSPFFGAELRT